MGTARQLVTRSHPSKTWVWFLPAIALVGITTVIPIGGLLVNVARPADLLTIWSRPGVRQAMTFSAWQASVSTVFTLAIGLPLAWCFARHDFPARRISYAILTIPFVLPTVVVATAMIALLPSSTERSVTSILIAHVFFNLSLVIRLVVPAWSVVHRDLIAAGRTLGASPVHVLRRIVLPLASPAIRSAAGLVFLMSFTSYGVVRILGGTAHSTVEVEIYRRAVLFGDVSGAVILAVVQTAIVVMAMIVISRRPPVPLAQIQQQRHRSLVWPVSTVAPATAAILVPLLALVLQSVRSQHSWTLRGWSTLVGKSRNPLPGLDPLRQNLLAIVTRSLSFAFVATAVAVPLGLLASIGLARSHKRWFAHALTVPTAVSAVAVGLGLIVTYDSTLWNIRSKWWLIPLVHAVIALPFVIRSILGVALSIPPGLRHAAETLGTSPWRYFWRVEIPILAPSIATGFSLSMALSLGEFGATSFLTRRETTTLPILIGQLLGRAGDLASTTAMAASTLLLLLTASIVLVSDTSLRS